MTEPALVDPWLHVDRHRPDWEGRGLKYWPSYESIPPASRAAYLTWLADGRRHAGVPISYVFLFFYGLERRALVDAASDIRAQQDVPAIVAETRRLLGLYGANGSFRSYATEFLRGIELERATLTGSSPPPLSEDRWNVPPVLRDALAQFAASGKPVPAAWARAWSWYHPQLYPRTPQTRCPDEFDRLFAIRYQQRFGAGMAIKARASQKARHYRTASAGIGTVTVRPGLPDVFDHASPAKQLGELIDSVTSDLDAYSRWLGKNPDGRGSLSAVALLPAELVDRSNTDVAEIRDWANGHLGEAATAIVDATGLISRWPTATPGMLSRSEALAAAQLLSQLGIGIEPDVRFGGPVPSPGKVVLFSNPGKARSPSPAYSSATMLMHLAVAVGLSDGHVDQNEHEHLLSHIETGLGLSRGERTRLQAHVEWLIAGGAKLTGLKKRLSELTPDEREGIAQFVVTVAAADGVIDPAEVATLVKIFTLLDREPATMFEQLHEHATLVGTRQRQPPAEEPVVVQPAGAASVSYRLPTPPAPEDRYDRSGSARGPETHPEGTPPQIVLDQRLIAQRRAETAKVASLLSAIFTEEDSGDLPPRVGRHAAVGPTAVRPSAATTASAGTCTAAVTGLDPSHSALLRDLAGQDAITASAFAALAEQYGLLPAGAIDVLNELALDRTGDPLLDGEEDMTIDNDVLQELLG